MKNTNIPSSPSKGGGATPRAAVETLHALIDDIDEFLSSWVQKIDHDMLSIQCSQSPDHLLRKRFHEFEKEKRQWEAMRKCEAQLVRERSDQLTAAWLLLEAEQRRFLQIKQSHLGVPPATSPVEVVNPVAKGAANAASTVATGEPDQGKRAESVDPLSGNSGRGSSMSDTDASVTSNTRSREAAVRQFRRLQQEIGSLDPDSGRS